MKVIEEDLDGDNFFGPQIVMSNKILDRIVDLAHYFKITTPTSLLQQTGWCYSLDYGGEIIAIIKARIPFPTPQPPATTRPVEPHTGQVLGTTSSAVNTITAKVPASAGTLEGESSTTGKRRATRKCRACGSTLHIGMYSASILFYLTYFCIVTGLPASNKHCPNYVAKPRRSKAKLNNSNSENNLVAEPHQLVQEGQSKKSSASVSKLPVSSSLTRFCSCISAIPAAS